MQIRIVNSLVLLSFCVVVLGLSSFWLVLCCFGLNRFGHFACYSICYSCLSFVFPSDRMVRYARI